MSKIQDIIEDGYKAGDAIRIQCSLGIKEGYIMDFREDRIRLQPFDPTKKPISIKEESIGDYEEAEVPEGAQPLSSIDNTPKIDNTIITPKTENGEIEKDRDIALPNTIVSESNAASDNIVNEKNIVSENTIIPEKVVEQNCKPISEIKEEIPVLTEKEKRKLELKRLKREAKQEEKKESRTSIEGLASKLGVEQEVKKLQEGDDETLIREKGRISWLGDSYGFIIDNRSGAKLWFSTSELIEKTTTPYRMGDLVVYTKSQNNVGETAFCIHKPMKVKEILQMAQRLALAGKRTDANEVLTHVFAVLPNCYSAIEKQKEINKSTKTYHPVNFDPEAIQLYSNARKFNDEKNFPKAIEYYLKAIGANQKTQSAIKDLGNIYIQLAKKSETDNERAKWIKEAKSFIEKYGKKLSTNNSTLSFLENFYYAIKDFENFKSIARRMLKNADDELEGPRHVFLLNKLASVLIRENNITQARELLNKALDIYPEGNGALKLLEIIDNAENHSEEEIESIISANEIEAFSGKISPFIMQTLEELDDYAGLKIGRATGKEKITLKDLKSIRDQIDKFSEKELAGRPTERARLLLTEGKLMLELEPENTFRLRSVMARYCNDMAKIHAFNNIHDDVIRFFYNEAFALEDKYYATAQQVAYYLLSNVLELEQLTKELSKSPSVDTALNQLLGKGFEPKYWYSILNMFLCNREISAHLISKFFENDNFKEQAIKALKLYGINFPINSKDDFVNAWNTAIENRNNDYRKVVASIKSFENINNIEDLATSLQDNLDKVRTDWMVQLDVRRLNRIITTIAPSLAKYNKAVGYSYKELNYRETSNLVSAFIQEIKEEPTKLSYEALLPLLMRIQNLLETSFKKIVEASRPIPSVILLHNESAVDNHKVKLQIEVSIPKECSPIYNVGIAIIENNDIQLINAGENNPLPYRIEGGDKYIFQPTIRVSDKVLQQQAVAFEVICTYDNAGVNEKMPVSLSLHLYDSNDFVDIDNPYAVVAESGPLADDSDMFYGQQKYILDVVERIMASPSNQVIIYGQKRSGKSSVLNRVKKELTNKGAFCVSFSMGKIVRNISEFAFYHKILSEISESLMYLSMDGKEVPSFEIPTKKGFQEEDEENPVNTFTKYMRLFKRNCAKTKGWETKRLVILIDEFTYMYGAIKMGAISPTIMQQWKAVTQDEYSQFSVVLVGQDVVPAFKQEPYARNAFGVIKDLRLSYLDPKDAAALITQPILDNGKSRYIGQAVELIMDYTACNPYYIQIFCSTLVDYMNEQKKKSITEADVTDVAKRLTMGVRALDKAKFENLLSARESENEDDKDGTIVDDAIRIYKDDDVELVLRTIAKATESKVYVDRSDILTGLDEKIESGILKQLHNRDVLDKKDNNYKIKVRLYKEWLLNH